jgi:hypothetical protein
MALLCAFGEQKSDHALARAPKVNNKLVFYHNEPTEEYDVAFTFENTIPDFLCNNTQQNSDASIRNANQEAANQGRLYDAIIVGENTNRDIAITWKDKSKDNAIARVGRVEGVYLFVGCEPKSEYEVVYKKDVSSTGAMLGMCPSESKMATNLMKAATKKKIDFDAVLIGNSKNDMVIKFVKH